MRYLLVLIFASFAAQAQTSPSVSPQKISGEEVLTVTAPESSQESQITAKSSLKENQIPVQLEPSKKSNGSGSPLFKIIVGLLGVATLGFGGVAFIKKYMRNSGEMKSAPQIKVLTQHYLGPKKQLAIVRVAGESILIGVTDHNISMLKSLSLLDDEIPEETPMKFDSVFNPESLAPVAKTVVAVKSEDEFSISGIKDFVSTRLKNMRSLD